MAGCNDSAQQATWCPTSTDDVLPSVLGLLPPGPAWDGAQQPGTVMNMFWRSISNLTGWAYGRLCDFYKELFCHTATESLDQWMLDYGLPNDCDPYGNNLCVQVTAVGGQDFATFYDMAQRTGWVVEFKNMRELIHEPYVGCMMAGAAQCSTKPVPATNGWMGVFTGDAVAGCMVAGDACPATGSATARKSDGTPVTGYYKIKFEVQDPVIQPIATGRDSTGKFSSWGQMFTWVAIVDLPASYALQGVQYSAPADPPISNAGNFLVGGTSLCATTAPAQFALCWLESIAPAHTKLVTRINTGHAIKDATGVTPPPTYYVRGDTRLHYDGNYVAPADITVEDVLTPTLDNLQAAVDALTNDVEQLDPNITQLSARIQSAQASLTSFSQEVEMAQGELAQLSEQVRVLSGEADPYEYTATTNGAQAITLPDTPLTGSVSVAINGLGYSSAHFTVSGATVNVLASAGVVSGDTLTINYRKQL